MVFMHEYDDWHSRSDVVPESFIGVSIKFKRGLKFKRCFKNGSRRLRWFTESFKGVSRKFKRCFKEVLGKFQGCVKQVSRVFQVFLRGVQWY